MEQQTSKPCALLMGRRNFLCQSSLICGLLPAMMANKGLGEEQKDIPKENKQESPSKVNPVELTTYCGMYCGACDIYQKRIGKAAGELKKIMGIYGFSTFASQIPGLEEFGTFEKVLDNLIMIFGQCQTCRQGGGDPECKIRRCCKDKGLETCAQCDAMPCDKILSFQEHYPRLIEDLQEIKKTGLETWSQKQQKRVDEGLRYTELLAEAKKGQKKV
jgi:hypothetical protein